MRYIKITKLTKTDAFIRIKQWIYDQVWIQKDGYEDTRFWVTTDRAWRQFIEMIPYYEVNCINYGIYFLKMTKYKVIEL